MKNKRISAKGERAAIGGYLPQFDEFAWFVYLNLINKELEWIRIADPVAEKLDDIQYSTHSEVHVYQVKWTISDANISFTNFKELFPLVVSSWQKLKKVHPNKKVIPHLITNKSISFNDSLKSDNNKIGSFNDFNVEVLLKLKSNQDYEDKWKPFVEELKTISNLSNNEFKDFFNCFDFQTSYKQKKFTVKNVKYSKEDEDLQKLSRFIIEKVASPDRIVEFKRDEIIRELGWTGRFKTVFDHELIIDRQSYQPIQTTINLLNNKLVEHNKGYLFLVGGPGTGKSTLLNQWSKEAKKRVVKYYAFDFVNPSSHLNFYERGNAIHLFYDLVFQLQEQGVYKKDILPYKDLIFLKEVFNEQLRKLGQDYTNDNKETIIIIDGLDHVPREYKSVTSFLRELPLPSTLPEGVFIILGSQSYELEDIPREIRTDFSIGNRTIPMTAFSKEEVYKYIDNVDTALQINNNQKLKIFEKSQGHPLYLSYLIEKINSINSVDEVIEGFIKIDGSIDNYYNKIWEPIQTEADLINLLGLIARINGLISLDFIKEWRFNRSVVKLFMGKAKFLFNETDKHLSFFHNSFKQFLLHHTALDYWTKTFDNEVHLSYHKKIAEYYEVSNVEPSWKQNIHLFQSMQYDKFILKVTPDSFTEQILKFRPVEEIKNDAKLGIEIAKQNNDVHILIRYLFVLAEFEKRQFNINIAGLTEEFLILNKYNLAKNYLRTGTTLHCKEAYALKASRLFVEFGYKSEGKKLFSLAYPEIITNNGILIGDSHRYDEARETLMEWVHTAPYFEPVDNIFSIIDNIIFSKDIHDNRYRETESDLNLVLVTNLGYSFIELYRWNDFNLTLGKIDNSTPKHKDSLFRLLQYAIEHCLKIKDDIRANEYLTLLKKYFLNKKTSSTKQIYVANAIYKVTQDIKETYDWIKDLPLPKSVVKRQLDYEDSLNIFHPLIIYNKLLNVCDKGIPITSAVPSAKRGTDEELLVEFERMLCLIAQILSDGILQKAMIEDIKTKTYPLMSFYYRDVSHRHRYWYKLTKSKSSFYNFLIIAVSKVNIESLIKLGEYFFNEFASKPKYWTASVQREIIKSLLDNRFPVDKALVRLRALEPTMLKGHDIDGKINECLAHSRVWLSVGDYDTGERWIKKAIEESIGIGYRKDLQFSTWIDWLKKINQLQKDEASDRLKWFLSHLDYIKDTTEGRAYWDAASRLLEIAFEISLDIGLEQAKWQLNNNIADFHDVLSYFIEHFITYCENEYDIQSIIYVYNELYLLLSKSADIQLLQCLLQKGYKVLGEVFMIKYIPFIIESINVKGYEKIRDSLLLEVYNFYVEQGVDILDYYLDFTISKNDTKKDLKKT